MPSDRNDDYVKYFLATRTITDAFQQQQQQQQQPQQFINVFPYLYTALPYNYS